MTKVEKNTKNILNREIHGVCEIKKQKTSQPQKGAKNAKYKKDLRVQKDKKDINRGIHGVCVS